MQITTVQAQNKQMINEVTFDETNTTHHEEHTKFHKKEEYRITAKSEKKNRKITRKCSSRTPYGAGEVTNCNELHPPFPTLFIEKNHHDAIFA
ncbi:hypothetical protein NECAME_01101 [Necator americanus]|uniref:Uncharacterized protein n=1 Tax=Necator americanus TaxID=51031 RepID=W2SJD7_NECAM|nr:hypothetical protein NECAME_01101 [Necator americanus]ETN68991.1 hypothetical protein NECAME_01101 [Necator americanus]